MEIKIGKYEGDAVIPSSLATCLEFTLLWGADDNDSADLLRLCAAAIGVGLAHRSILPLYKPNKAKIAQYGYRILERLLELSVTPDEIFKTGTQILTAMAKKIPQQREADEKADFFPSPAQDG